MLALILNAISELQRRWRLLFNNDLACFVHHTKLTSIIWSHMNYFMVLFMELNTVVTFLLRWTIPWKTRVIYRPQPINTILWDFVTQTVKTNVICTEHTSSSNFLPFNISLSLSDRGNKQAQACGHVFFFLSIFLSLSFW